MFSFLKSNKFFNTVLLLSFILALGASFWRYYYQKDYDFYVEASCEPYFENCYQRDCENDPDSCPPNGLSNYKVFKIKAYDFEKCSDNSCKYECESGMLKCEEVMCGGSEEDVCSLS